MVVLKKDNKPTSSELRESAAQANEDEEQKESTIVRIKLESDISSIQSDADQDEVDETYQPDGTPEVSTIKYTMR